MGNRLVADAVLKPYMGNQAAKPASNKRSGGGGGSSYGSSGDDYSVSEEAFGRSAAGGGGRRGSVSGAGVGGASGGAARTEGTKNLKWSNLSTAPLTTTNVGPKKLGTKSGSETITYSDGNFVSDTDIFEQLNRVSPEDRIVTLSAARIGGGSTEPKSDARQRSSTFSSGNDKGVRHVTFGGAWESDAPIPTTQPHPPPPPPSPESKGILRRSQLRQTSVQTTSRDNRGHEKISDSKLKNNIKMKHTDK